MTSINRRCLEISLLVITLLIGAGCQTVRSSELRGTAAADLELDAVVREYTDSNQVFIGAQMQTVQSQVGIEFDQGETLTASYQLESGIAPMLSLSNSTFLNLDKDYEGTLVKTIAGGNYYITYKDSQGVETLATFATGSVAEIITPAEGAILNQNQVEITWDPNAMRVGTTLKVSYTWSSGSVIGLGVTPVDNLGSYFLNTSGFSGSGEISLVNTTLYSEMDEFGSAHIDMQNISRRHVSFGGSSRGFATRSVGGDEEVTSLLNQCKRRCGEGEEHYLIINDEKYSCCQE